MMCKGALKGEIVVQGKGGQERDFVFIEDVVKALCDVPIGEDFSVRTGAYYTVHQIARIIAELSGADIVYADRPPGDVDRPSDAWPQFPMSYTPLEEGLEMTWNYFKSHS
jgi:nucleoside-diphosphate-sugar epimerase